jgi:hypothetical protein
VQFREYRHRRRAEVAAELCRRFAEPDLARAVTLLRRLPDGVSLRTLQSMDTEYEEAAQIFGMAIETMGLLVHENIASFQMIRELTGGLLLSMWRKIETWVRETRVELDNPRFAEWVEWLVDRIAECEREMVPAYVAHREWRRKS